MDILGLIGRKNHLFEQDINDQEQILGEIISNHRFLVLGAAGTIGQAVTKEIFKRNPKTLHVVDISENNLVELIRDIRSSFGYIPGDFQSFALDINSWHFDALIAQQDTYDYVLNLSALKHVRSEKDPFTLMRMIEVNILNTIKTIHQSKKLHASKYFCVSTDKAANPVNMMGGSKRIMEMFLMNESSNINISTARFANVAFSDGSLLHGFNQRIIKGQPLVAPNDIKRYFVTPQESGELCLMSTLLGENRDIFFPKLDHNHDLITFSEIAIKYLENLGYEPHICSNEDEARALAKEIPQKGKWPCLFSPSNTTGEKDFEEFFTEEESLDLDRFKSLGVIKNGLLSSDKLDYFLDEIQKIRTLNKISKEDIVSLFHELIPNFGHLEKGIYLDSKM